MTKTYELPNGRKMSADFDENGIGKITVQALDSLVNELNEYAEQEPIEECDHDCEHCAYLECTEEDSDMKVEYEDAVSRQYLLDNSWEVEFNGEYIQVVDVGTIVEAPSVQPKAKTGVWMRVLTVSPKVFCNRCSECGYEQFYAERYNFCPYCGAGMRGEEE